MKAVVTVLGKDKVGIIKNVSTIIAEKNANILDISQTIMQENIFTMVMYIDIKNINCSFNELSTALSNEGKEMSLVITVQHEEIFNSMHRI